MNSKQRLNRQSDREFQFSKDANAQASKLIFWLNQIWRSLLQQLLKGNEPQVRQARDRSGKIRWRVYDPVSGRSHVCLSEQEVRMWLEEVLYR